MLRMGRKEKIFTEARGVCVCVCVCVCVLGTWEQA